MDMEIIQPEIEAREHPNFRTINVSGAYGGVRPMYFEVVLYSDEFKLTKVLSTAKTSDKPLVNRTIECRLIIDPFQAKIISQWLASHVNEYESKFGRIPSPEEIQDKAPSSKSDNNKNTKTVYQ